MKKSVVIADNDVEFVREMVEKIGEGTEFQLAGISTSGTDTLKLLEQQTPDLLLLNILLPGLDGIGVLEAIDALELPKRPEIILLSSVREQKALAYALSIGASFAILKPVGAQTVIERMHMLAEPYQELVEQEEPTDTVEAAVTWWLHKCAISPNLSGYQYLRDAIMLVVKDHSYLYHVTRRLYPAVAKKRNTTPSRTERAIRHAISRSVEKTDPDWMLSVFQTNHPVNSEFIGVIAEQIMLKRKKHKISPRTR